MDVYTNSDLEQKRAAVNQLDVAVLRKPQAGVGVTTVRRAYQTMKAKRGLPKPGG